MKPVTPKKIDAQLKALLDYLVLDESTAVHLKFARPNSFEPEVDQCHFNVWCQLNEYGGESQHGWVLAQDKSFGFAEAIFHTVWRSPSGDLHDVTPRKNGEKRVLFVPDNTRAITLSNHEDLPAIMSYDNVQISRGILLTPLEKIKIVMQSDFVHRHKLFPW